MGVPVNAHATPAVLSIPKAEREVLNCIQRHAGTIASFMNDRGATKQDYFEAHAAIAQSLKVAQAQGLLDRPHFIIDCIVMGAAIGGM